MGKWHTIRLIRLAEFINGYGFKPDDWSKEGLPIIRIEQLKNPLAQHDYYSGKLPERNIIDNGDLIFSWSASLFLRIWDRGKAALNQHLFKVIPYDETDILFLKYLIEFNLGKLLLSAHGSTMQHITRKELEKFDVYLPEDKPEQTQIAQILSKTDLAIAQTEALIAKYQRIKTGLMQDLLTHGIDEHGNIRSEQTHRFKTEKGLRVPEEWEVKTFNELLQDNIIADIQDGNHGERHPKGSDFVKEGVPFIMASDISKNEIDFTGCKKITEEQYHSLRIGFAKPGDVLLSHKASIGFVAVVPEEVDKIMLTPQVTYYRIKNKEKLDFRYLSLFMRGEIFQNELSNLAKQSTRDYIGILMQRNLTLAYPIAKREQLAIADKIEAINSHLKAENKKLFKSQSLKTGLMQDLLSGKVKVKINEEQLANS